MHAEGVPGRPYVSQQVEAFNRSLGDRGAVEAIQAHYTDCFIGAGLHCVRCGQNDAAFTDTLRQGFDFYTSIGTKAMAVRGVTRTPIDELHQLAAVDFRAAYEKSSGETVAIDFTVTYFMASQEGTFKIFGFVSGDEMAAYREHGLIAG
jgi:hypothetical protein